MRPKVHVEKHLVQISLATVAAGAISNLLLVNARAAPVAATPSSVREGCTISAIYIEMWIQTDDTALGSSIVTLEKVPGAGSVMTAAESALLNDYVNKKNVFYTQMGLTPTSIQFPMAVIKGWFKIPKGKQRFSLNDSIELNVHAQSNGLSICGFAVFKEQY